jgi:hypothetical protein
MESHRTATGTSFGTVMKRAFDWGQFSVDYVTTHISVQLPHDSKSIFEDRHNIGISGDLRNLVFNLQLPIRKLLERHNWRAATHVVRL